MQKTDRSIKPKLVRKKKRRGLAKCGTEAARRRHKKHGESCRKCMKPKVYRPCGTDAAHRRHLRSGDTPCGPCMIAHRAAVSEAKKRRRLKLAGSKKKKPRVRARRVTEREVRVSKDALAGFTDTELIGWSIECTEFGLEAEVLYAEIIGVTLRQAQALFRRVSARQRIVLTGKTVSALQLLPRHDSESSINRSVDNQEYVGLVRERFSA